MSESSFGFYQKFWLSRSGSGSESADPYTSDSGSKKVVCSDSDQKFLDPISSSLDVIVVSKDAASEAEHYSVERPSRDQKFHSHILVQREALFWYKQYDRLFLHRESPKALCPWNRHPIKPLLSVEIFVFA